MEGMKNTLSCQRAEKALDQIYKSYAHMHNLSEK